MSEGLLLALAAMAETSVNVDASPALPRKRPSKNMGISETLFPRNKE